MTETRIEWGRQLDCTAEGCDPKHSDEDRVFLWAADLPRPAVCPLLNKARPHAVRWVQRTITVSPWTASYD